MSEETKALGGDTLLNLNGSVRKVVFIFMVVLCLTPYVSPPVALLLGLVIAQLIGHPYARLNNKATHILLQVSVVGLGFGMNVQSALQAGKQGILFTIVSISGTLALGALLGYFFKIERKTATLVACGTAICGGSAIAAIAPVIRAEEKQISVALGTVFILNSIALFLFPAIGHWLHLSQSQFGLWCAIAIHDTSSVVGAASKYGDKALQIATTVKLARALWIIPIALLASVFSKSGKGKIKIPYFIGLFVVAIILNTYLPIAMMSSMIVRMAKAGLTLTLFLIGAGLSRKILGSVGIKPFLQGIILWITISVVSLWSIMNVIH